MNNLEMNELKWYFINLEKILNYSEYHHILRSWFILKKKRDIIWNLNKIKLKVFHIPLKLWKYTKKIYSSNTWIISKILLIMLATIVIVEINDLKLKFYKSYLRY